MPDPLGRACLFPGQKEPCITVVDVCIVRPTSVSHQWLMYIINSPEIQIAISKLQSGTTRKRISKKNLCTIQFPIPPRSEQDRTTYTIESYLSRLDAAVESLKRVEANLKRYRASVLQAAVEGRLVPTEASLARAEGRDYEPADELLKRILVERKRKLIEDAAEKGRAKAEAKAEKADKTWTAADDEKALKTETAKAEKKYKEPTPPETNGLPELPEGWCWANLNELKGYSIYGPRFSNERYSARGTFVLRTTDIDDSGRVNIESAPRIVLTQNELKKYLVPIRK